MDWSGCDKSDANLFRAYLIDANLIDAFLRSANLIDAFLHRADLTRANLTEANLRGAICHNSTIWPDGSKGHGDACLPPD